MLFRTSVANAIDVEQLKSMLPGGTTLEASITTPEEFLGFEIGSRHVRHHEVVAYSQKLCDESNRLSWHSYGKTWGGRPLGIVVASRADRQSTSQLEAIAKDRRDWAFQSNNPRNEKMPPSVAWLGYSIHGDEACGTNASLLVLYVLAAAKGPWIEAILDQHILLIDPSLNPDGFDRFSSWVNDHRGNLASADSSDIEHQQGWPRGRSNHYNFDLNRDWLPVTQPESRGRLKLYHEWLPNLVLDFHEMGEQQSLFFQPGIEGRDHPMTPAFVREITQGFAKRYAAVSDAASERFFTQERYDDFYPGKGSTYPDLHGSVGILVEQGSTRGLIHEYAGVTRTFEQTILNPFRLSLASIDGLYEQHRTLMVYQRDFYGSQRNAWLSKSPKAFLIEIPTDNRVRNEFLNFIGVHHLDAFLLGRDVEIEQRKLKAKKWWILPSDQPQGLFLQAIVDRTHVFPFDKFYDVSAWNMPDAFGLQWFPVLSDYDPTLHGNHAVVAQSQARVPSSSDSTFPPETLAVAIPGRDINSMSFMSHWLAQGLRIRMAKVESHVTTFESESLRLPPGSLVIHRGDQREFSEDLLDELQLALTQHKLPFHPIRSSLTERGPDLGSENFPLIRKPKIAMLVGEGTNANDAGSLWFTIDRMLSIPITRLEPTQLRSERLANYNLLFIPDGEQTRFTDKTTETLRDWITSGGHAVLLGGSLSILETLTSKTSANKALNPFDEPKDEQKPILPSSDGIILESRVFGKQMLKAAIGNRSVLVYQSDSLWPIKDGPVLKLTEKPLVAGYLNEADQSKIAERTVMGVSKVGQGLVTSMTFNPTFRGHYWGTIGLLREVIFREAE
jgi:Zinc carboxypeptidase